MEKPVCPFCNGSGILIDHDAAVESKLDELRANCSDMGIPISIGRTILEADLACLLGKSPNTVRNWRMMHQPITPQKIAGRWRYALDDIARWLIEEN